MPQDQPLISLRSATLMRGGVPVLRDLAFDIRPGEHIAILGPNGSGKSSFIRLITRQDYPLAVPGAEPAMLILGQERWDVFELRSHLGIVSADLHQAFTHGQGFGRTRGLETVMTGFFSSFALFDHLRVTDSMRERAHAALALVGAEHLAGLPMDAMSTGEARRILIARALAPDPGALLLDEPTTGLDLAARRRFLKTLSDLAGLGKTLILVTHHVEEIIPEIERVILLKEGRVFRDGHKRDVLRSGPVSELFGLPVRVQRHGEQFSAY
ncbi:MAG: ATP-binding cassette domain-containing protein [Holophaga sp.]|nr:ATP-binding cassette domain-containing protein [Holophaga sp.]